MESNKQLLTLVLLTALTIILSCNGDNNNKHISDKSVKSLDSYNHIRQSLKGAELNTTIVNKKTFYFSNSETKDTFSLTITAGLISNATCELRIIKSNGHVIYSEKFDADYLIRYIFEPDTFPHFDNQEADDRYILHYVNSLTKKQFETYTRNSIKTFFDNLFITKTELKSVLDDSEILDKSSYDEITSDTNSKIIYFPCFECDEGGTYIGYSKSKDKAVKLIASD